MKWPIPVEPNSYRLDNSYWFTQLWNHLKGDPAWIDATLENSWVNYSASYNTQYRLKSGIVFLEGLVKSGTTTANTTILTLPEGYRPSQTLILPTLSNGALGRVNILTDGSVDFVTGSNVWFALNFSFYADA